MRFLQEHVLLLVVLATLAQLYRGELTQLWVRLAASESVSALLHTAYVTVRAWTFLDWLKVCATLWITQRLMRSFLMPFHKHVKISEVQAQKVRRNGSLPPPYPNGWFHLVNSADLQRGQVKEVHALGHHFAVFRGQDGKAAVLDAYCPHLGANLCHGGEVKDNCLVCPFHGWTFNGEGKCVNIPYSSSIPSVGHTTAWLVHERNGAVYVWHHIDSEAPHWELPVIDAIDSGKFVFHGSTRHHVGAHCQEIPENGADVAHLHHLHVPFLSKIIGTLFALEHEWDAKWKPSVPPNTYRSEIALSQSLRWFGYRIPFTTINVEINQVGPGVVNLHFFLPFFGLEMYTVETVTPVKPLEQRCTHTLWATWAVPRFFAKFVLQGLCIQFERDVPIWNHKTFLSRPVVVKTDGPILQFRRWYQQFYSKGSRQAAAGGASNPSSLQW